MKENLVISYSKNHFIPGEFESNTGTGFLAMSLFKLLKRKHPFSKLDYYDYTEFDLASEEAKLPALLVSISSNINLFNEKLRPKQSLLFAVNYSALHRRKIRSEARKFGFSFNKLTHEDGIFSNLMELKGTTGVVTLGNYSNYLSYVHSGAKPWKVFPFANTLGHSFSETFEAKKVFGDDILYFPGGTSFRKGLSIIEPILDMIQSESMGIKLRIIGQPANEQLSDYLSMLTQKFSENLHWERNWTNRNDLIWDENITKSRFAVFPSFEEGIPATVLDLIESGVPVLYSSECGLDFVSEEVVMTSFKVNEWIKLIRSTHSKSDFQIFELLNKQRLMMRNLPSDLIQVESVLDRLCQESLWPGILVDKDFSLTIPKNSWLYKSQSNPQYEISFSKEGDDFISINWVRCGTRLKEEALVAFAVSQLDRYQVLNELRVIHADLSIDIRRINPVTGFSQNRCLNNVGKLELFSVVRESKHYILPKVFAYTIQWKDLLFRSIRYRFGRLVSFQRNSK